MKKTYKEQEQAQRRKNIIKWVFAGLGWTLLLGLFILLTTLGVRGCVDKNKRSVQESTMALNVQEKKPNMAIQYDDYNYLYECSYHGDTAINSSTMKLLGTRVLGTNPGWSTNQNDIEINDYYSGGLAYWLNDEFVNCTRTRIILKTVQDYSGSLYYYRVDSFAFFDDLDNVQYAYLSLTHPYLSSNTSVRFYDNGSLVVSRELAEEGSHLFDVLLHPFYTLQEYKPFAMTFNNQVNYNCYFDTDINNDWVVSGNELTQDDIYLDYGVFVSGGQIFNRIKVHYISALNVRFVNSANDYSDLRQCLEPYGLYYSYMSYVNTNTGVEVIVNVRDFTRVSNQSPGSTTVWYNCPVRRSTWTSQNYRDIQYLYGLSEQRLAQLNRLNNNSAYINSGSTGGSDLSGIFNLLGSAFNTWASIFNMTLIPGLSIGVFVFLPLVVTIIVLVFKAVKK